jgi:hypothetical protein
MTMGSLATDNSNGAAIYDTEISKRLLTIILASGNVVMPNSIGIDDEFADMQFGIIGGYVCAKQNQLSCCCSTRRIVGHRC